MGHRAKRFDKNGVSSVFTLCTMPFALCDSIRLVGRKLIVEPKRGVRPKLRFDATVDRN
jgi:hypothetical protein